MRDDVDDLLSALSAQPADHSLSGLEASVFGRIAAQRQAQGLSAGLRMRAGVALAALAIGVVIGGVQSGRNPGRSEMVVLSEDAGLAPSVAIEGGA